MPVTGKFKIVLVTAPDLKTARRLARAALTARLIACANLIPKIESHYRWQGKIERGHEVMLVMKTTRARLGALEKLVLAQHPYTTPEFIVLPLTGGSKGYLAWLAQSCKSSKLESSSGPIPTFSSSLIAPTTVAAFVVGGGGLRQKAKRKKRQAEWTVTTNSAGFPREP